MRKYKGSHDDFDYFVVPTVPAIKQQQDTTATLAELMGLRIPASRIRIVFNQVEDGIPVTETFEALLAFIAQNPVGVLSTRSTLSSNEIYQRVKGTGTTLAQLAADETDYKGLIARASNTADKLALAQRLATRRLALGVLPELDRCFAALELA